MGKKLRDKRAEGDKRNLNCKESLFFSFASFSP
jgi:hypothetical protein